MKYFFIRDTFIKSHTRTHERAHARTPHTFAKTKMGEVSTWAK